MIEQIYRVKVTIQDGVDVLHTIQTHKNLDLEFSRNFIEATNGSIDAQTDGYNGEMFADYLDLDKAMAAHELLNILAKWATDRVKQTLADEEAEFMLEVDDED